MTDSMPSGLAAPNGAAPLLREWPLRVGDPLRGAVILVHGLGEHIGRYTDLAERLNQWGFWVWGYDQYGHGEAPGPRGSLPQPDRLLTDLAAVIDSVRHRQDDHTPIILFGHSMGGAVTARLISLNVRRVDGLVLLSPALDAGLSAWQKALVAIFLRLAPSVRLGHGMKMAYLSHDPAVLEAYLRDPLVHDRISAPLARFIAEAGPVVLAHAAQWTVPTLLLYAGQDRLVSPAGSRAFAAAAPEAVVRTHVFPMHYHELLNELDREQVYEALGSWLQERFPLPTPRHAA